MFVTNWLLRADPARTAVNALTYGELLDRALRADVPARARVGIALPAGEDFAIALHAVWLRGGDAVPHDLRLPPAQRPPADHVIEELSFGAPAEAAPIDLDATALLLHTSGTTAAPRPVELTFGNLLWSALGSGVALGTSRGERWLSALPLSHVGGLSVLVRSAIQSTTALVHQGWDTERVAGALRDDGVTMVSLVPTTLARLLDAGLCSPPTLRWALLGGGPISDDLLERARTAGIPVAPTYGLTEAASQVTTNGAPLFCTRVELAGDGEILVSGPTVAPAAGPVLRTGDLGLWAPDGTLRITGRKADTIISGGENVAPAEVEAVLERHPAVAEVLVEGRPDPQWGEAVAARVVLRSGAEVGPDELRRFCRAHLAAFKVPREFRFVADLPRTSSGKLRRQRTESLGGTER